MKIRIEGTEIYPWYVAEPAEEDTEGCTYEVDEATFQRWQAILNGAAAVQRAMRDLVDPPCTECGHRQSRHQEWSQGWDYWGCLDRVTVERPQGTDSRACRCQHGKPEGR